MNYELSDDIPEISIPTEGFPCMANLINEQIEALEELWSNVAYKPNKRNLGKLDKALKIHTEAVSHAVEALRDEFASDSDAFRPMINYALGLERRRTEFLNELEDDEGMYVTPDMDIDRVFSSIEESGQSPIDVVNQLYQADMSTDMIRFCNNSVSNYTEKPHVIRNERAKMVGAHVLDVAKIGLGVVGGVFVAKKAKLL